MPAGLGSLAPLGSPLPEMPPLKPPGQQAEFQGGIYAAAVIVAALLSRMKTGRGQAIEISEQEILAAALELGFIFYTYEAAKPRAWERARWPRLASTNAATAWLPPTAPKKRCGIGWSR